MNPVKFLAHVYAYPGSVHNHLHLSFSTVPSECPADGSLLSDFSPISISGRSLHRSRRAIPREPSSGKHSQTILGPVGIIQNMCLDNTDKGRKLSRRSRLPYEKPKPEPAK